MIKDKKLEDWYGYVIVDSYNGKTELYEPELVRNGYQLDTSLNDIQKQCTEKYPDMGTITVYYMRASYSEIYVYGNHDNTWEYQGMVKGYE